MATPLVAGLVALYMEEERDNNNLTRADGPAAMTALLADATENRVDTLYDAFAPLPLAFSNVGRPPLAQPPPPPPHQKPPVPKTGNPFRILGRPSSDATGTKGVLLSSPSLMQLIVLLLPIVCIIV